jgi:lipopolysaccharide export system protein LptA
LKLHLSTYILLFLSINCSLSFSQEKKKIRVTAPYYDKNEAEYPGATILTRNSKRQIYIEHDGIEMWCDKAYHYAKEDSIAAFGKVLIKQGDTIKLTSKVANYSGKTQLAFTAGDVLLTEPKSTLRTDTLYFDKIKQQAYYKTGGVVHHEENIINSYIGKYDMESQKYQFIGDVDIKNPEYTLNSSQLDFYSNSGVAYMYGKSVIKHKGTTIYCERGYYDTNADLGYFVKNSKIFYNNRIVEGDSLYFNQKRNFASATNNIKITDTVNHSVVTGHYAEVYKAKDSVFITKRALVKSFQQNDSLYIHADTLMITGKPEERIIRGFKNARLFKTDMNGKCDSIHINQKSGITKLIHSPVLWSGNSQMTGDTIQLINNIKTNKLDSLKVFYNTFIIHKDSIDGFNQVKGKELIGLFNKENKLYNVDINKNAEHIQYSRKDNGELIGISKTLSSSINLSFIDNEIEEATYIGSPEGDLTPDSMYPKNARKLRGFNWRGDERILSVQDLFKDDPPLELVKIKGLEDRVLVTEDDELRSVTTSKKTTPLSVKSSKKIIPKLPNNKVKSKVRKSKKRTSLIKK